MNELFTRIESAKHQALLNLQVVLDDYQLKLLGNSEAAALQLRRLLQEFLGLRHLCDKQKNLRPELASTIYEQLQEINRVLQTIETHLTDPYKFPVQEIRIRITHALELSDVLLARSKLQPLKNTENGKEQKRAA